MTAAIIPIFLFYVFVKFIIHCIPCLNLYIQHSNSKSKVPLTQGNLWALIWSFLIAVRARKWSLVRGTSEDKKALENIFGIGQRISFMDLLCKNCQPILRLLIYVARHCKCCLRGDEFQVLVSIAQVLVN